MKIVILGAASLGDDIDYAPFYRMGEVSIYPEADEEKAGEQIGDADILVVNKLPVCEKTLKNAGNLKLVCVTATGINNLDGDYLKSRNIAAYNVAGYSTDAVAQHTFALLFYVLEKLNFYDSYVKSGKYSGAGSFTFFAEHFCELAGKTWGILGLGAIGRKVAQIAEAFNCRVICCSASGRKYDAPYEQVELDTLLCKSDVLSVHAPLNSYTEGILNREAFAKMKKTAILVNVARGAIVNEPDLYEALAGNQIAGAALDVLCREPMDPDNPLLRIQDSKKLIITPHIAWAATETRFRCMNEVAKNIERFFAGDDTNRVY